MPSSSPRARLALLVLCLGVAAIGCDSGPAATATPPAGSVPSRDPAASSAASSPATTDLDPAMAAALGPWRRIPFVVNALFSSPYEAACRSRSELATAPLKLVDDRGGDTVSLLFATPDEAYVCRLSARAAATVEDVAAIDIKAASLGDSGIDSVAFDRIQVTRSGRPELRTLAVGRVGPVPTDVIAIFTDQTPVNASRGGGWYLFWYPGQDQIQGISAVDHQHLVLSSVLPKQ